MAASKANPPFATSGGKPIAPASGAMGGRDFMKENRPSQTSDSAKIFQANATNGGFDVTKQMRPQTDNPDGEAQQGANPQEIPSGGGRILKADPPGNVTQNYAGGRAGMAPAAGPFKNLK